MDAVAVGTIILAGATLVLAGGVWWQVRLQGEQLAASERPAVYPITPHDWLETIGDGGRWLSFRNGGTGIARNVRGKIWWHTEGGEAALLGQTLGANDHARLRVGDQKRIGQWSGAEGYVKYEDVRGVEWQSRFRYEQTEGEVWASLVEWGTTKELGEPTYPRPGWAEEGPGEPAPERYRTGL
jgi:hypothetical protein